MKVVVIGAGAAGMMAAIVAAKEGNDVTILEKMEEAGNKLKITGKGRCNITFSGDFEYFKQNIVSNPKFMYSAYHAFTNQDTIAFFEALGVETKLERGNRVFLKSDNAEQVVAALTKELKKRQVIIQYHTSVSSLIVKEGKLVGVTTSTGKKFDCDKCIIATGGKSYPGTGSTGDGYRIAKEVGHTLVPICAGLVPVKSNDSICKRLQGLTLKNVKVQIRDKGKIIYQDFGEVLFAHFGLTGPTILSASSKLNRLEGLEEKLKHHEIVVELDLKPALSQEILDKRIQRDFEKYDNKEAKNAFDDLLPQKMIPYIIEKTGIDPYKRVHQITREERLRIIEAIKHLTIKVEGLMDISMAIVTCGGVSTKEINPKTMESKLVEGLYFAGEVIDIDAFTGGFNLQIAFSTGYVAGKNTNCDE